jgi:hypothetical protein
LFEIITQTNQSPEPTAVTPFSSAIAGNGFRSEVAPSSLRYAATSQLSTLGIMDDTAKNNMSTSLSFFERAA